MSRIDSTKGNTIIRRRSASRIVMAIVAGVLATASLAWADGDHTTTPGRLRKKDHFVRDALNRMTYADPTEITLVMTCDCVEPTCEGGFMISCGGEVDPGGILYAVRRTSRETCYVCGCAEFATLRATPVCID